MTLTREATVRALREAAAWRVVRGEAVMVEGPGAFDWLQGQVTQDLTTLSGAPKASSIPTLVLSPQGKIEALCRVTVAGDDQYLLDTACGYGKALRDRLARFKIRVKAQLSDVQAVEVVEMRGPKARSADLPGALVLATGWPAWSGWDLLSTEGVAGNPGDALSPGMLSALESAGAVGPGDVDAFEAGRIRAGMPVMGRELTEKTIPQEAGRLVGLTVSFSKGCYTGQELLARIDARGSNTPRRLRAVTVPAGTGGETMTPPPGAAIVLAGATVGEITSSAPVGSDVEAAVALAYVKRSSEPPFEAEVRWDGGSATAKVSPIGGGSE